MSTEPIPPDDAERAPAPFDATLIAALWSVVAVSVVLAVGGGVSGGLRTGIGVAVGGALATANMWVFALVVRGVLTGGARGRRWGAYGGLKFIVLLGLTALILWSDVASGLALAVGYAALPIGVTLGTLMAPKAQ